MLTFIRRCPHCGVPLSAVVAEDDEHECALDTLLAYQSVEARRELGDVEAIVAAWEREPRIERRLAFARWLREAA
jgi:hypothetical protein